MFKNNSLRLQGYKLASKLSVDIGENDKNVLRFGYVGRRGGLPNLSGLAGRWVEERGLIEVSIVKCGECGYIEVDGEVIEPGEP